jgi:hypothetical protein
MAIVNEVTPGSQDLATFQTVVQQQEQIYGPLTAIGTSGANNSMSFQFGTSPDAAHLATLAVYTDHPAPVAGTVLVCSGQCLVKGVATNVAAYRKSP